MAFRERPITRQMTSSRAIVGSRPGDQAIKRPAKTLSLESNRTGKKGKAVTRTLTGPMECPSPVHSAQSDASSSPDLEVSCREEAMKKYMRVALAGKRKKKSVTAGEMASKARDLRCSPEKAAQKMLAEYWMISVGKMNFDFKKQKGVLDRAFIPIKVPLHKESSHSEVLAKCINQVWKEAPEGECYLADGSGSKISGEDFPLSLREGGAMTLPWTLSNYMKLSGSVFPSRVRLYCVNIHGQRNEESEASPSHSGGLANATLTAVSGTGTRQSVGEHMSQPVSHADCSNPPVGYFQVSFMEKIPSRYTSSVTFRSGLVQEEILSTRFDDCDRMHGIEESLIESPLFRIFLENPLQLGFYLESITADTYVKYTFIENMDCVSGDVSYKMPQEGSCFEVWSGCYCSSYDKLAVMACSAINGYHGVATYRWEGINTAIAGEETPLLISGVGRYKCSVTARDDVLSREFIVSENGGVMAVKCVEPVVDGGGVAVKCENTVEYTSTKVKTEIMPMENILELEAVKSGVANAKELKELHILEEIGQGAFGRVFKAVWRGTVVAAKEVRTAGNQKILENEMSVYLSLNHPNLLSLLGTVSNKFSITLITNFVRGKTLHSLVFDSEEQLRYEEKIMVSRQLCQAIVFMHSAEPPIAHLDIKPENVMVEANTLRVYLGDFGLGKILTGTRVFGNSTMQAGTPGFQSPEQLRGEDLTTCCDVYAFGAVLTELFGMKPIWDKLTSHTIIYNVAHLGQMPKCDHLCPDIQAIVKSCLCPATTRVCAATILGMLCELP